MNEDIKKIRSTILDMVYEAHEGHIPSSFSIVEILYGIYSKLGTDDSFFLSKGHASAALFAILGHFGIIDKSELANYAKYDSKLGGHPHRFAKGVMASTGSLGHGFPIAAGHALAKKIKGEIGTVFCLVGDGETNEGTIWETAMYAEQLKLSNLVCIIDENLSQVRAMTSVNIAQKFEAFGWEIKKIDGHDLSQIDQALFDATSRTKPGLPFCVVARTVKGKGIKVMENDFFSWHHKGPNAEELAAFKAELMA
jgi:transketolase